MKILDVPKSGSANWQTASRNRYGQYLRNRSTPTNPQSSFQTAIRSKLSTCSTDYRSLTNDQRAGWASLGGEMHRTDPLGQDYTLTGFQAYASVNIIRVQCGLAVVADAPALQTPDSIASCTPTISDEEFSLAYTPTPLGAAEYLFSYCSPQRSQGRAYEGDCRLILVSAAAQASPFDILEEYTARFGVPVVSNRVFVEVRRAYLGFLSAALVVSKVVS